MERDAEGAIAVEGISPSTATACRCTLINGLIEEKPRAPSNRVYEVYDDGTSRTAEVFDTVKVASILHGERCDKKRHHRDKVFVDVYRPVPISKMNMCDDARRSLASPNAGGKSALSEMLSMQYMHQVYGAEDTLIEMEVEYWLEYKMVDYVCSVKGVRVGVSVTRAMTYPNPSKFHIDHARTLLNKKLYGLIVARNSVTQRHTFFKSVLHVWCQTQRIANLVKEAYEEMDVSDYGLDIRGEVILLLTVCDESYIYTDRPPEQERDYRDHHAKCYPRKGISRLGKSGIRN